MAFASATSKSTCYCVRYLARTYHIPISGNADTLIPNMKSIDAEVGDVMLMRYDDVYHVAMITNTTNEGYVVNEDWCGKKRTRFVSKFDMHIQGFLNF